MWSLTRFQSSCLLFTGVSFFFFVRLLLCAILQSKEKVVVSFGLVCSTFIAMSRGSTYRSYFLPLGDMDGSQSVARSNILASRRIHSTIFKQFEFNEDFTYKTTSGTMQHDLCSRLPPQLFCPAGSYWRCT